MYKIADIEHSMVVEQPLVISHEIVIPNDCTWTLRVHGHKVDPTICSALATVPKVLDSGSFIAFLQLVDSFNVCIGQPSPQFVALLQQKGNEIKSPDGRSRSSYIDDFTNVYCNEQCYPVTVRTSDCEILTSGTKCKQCKEYRATLRTLCNRLIKSSAKSNVSGSSHTNDRYVHKVMSRLGIICIPRLPVSPTPNG